MWDKHSHLFFEPFFCLFLYPLIYTPLQHACVPAGPPNCSEQAAVPAAKGGLQPSQNTPEMGPILSEYAP